MRRAFSDEIALIGAPVEEGAGRPGCSMGPKALRIAGIAENLAALGYRVEDMGDVAPEDCAASLAGKARNVPRVLGFARALAQAGEAALSSGKRAVYLGGDHSISFGTVTAALRHAAREGRALHVLWLDAHTDFNTPATSPSGNMHGMPAAFFCGEAGFEGALDGPRLPPERLHAVGVRSVDPEEREVLAARGVDVADMAELDEVGAAATIRRILEDMERENALLHVSLDVDFLDPEAAPGVGTTVPGGATFREAHLIMEMIHRAGVMVSLDLVELNPFLDDRGRSARLMVEFAGSGFGRRIFDRPTRAA